MTKNYFVPKKPIELLTLVFLLTFTSCAVEETPIISGERLQSGELEFNYQSVTAEGEIRIEGSVKENISIRDDNIVFSMQQDLPTFKVSDSLIMDINTLMPRSFFNYWQNMPQVSVKYTENSANVDIQRVIGTLPDTAYTVRFDAPVYDMHWLQPVVYGLNKQSADTLSLIGFSFYNEKETIEIKVEEEKKSYEGKDFDTWKLI